MGGGEGGNKRTTRCFHEKKKLQYSNKSEKNVGSLFAYCDFLVYFWHLIGNLCERTKLNGKLDERLIRRRPFFPGTVKLLSL